VAAGVTDRGDRNCAAVFIVSLAGPFEAPPGCCCTGNTFLLHTMGVLAAGVGHCHKLLAHLLGAFELGVLYMFTLVNYVLCEIVSCRLS